MTFEDFKNSTLHPEPPTGISNELLSLWYDAKDNWDKAHAIIQKEESADAFWIHAYLHRKEGDISNAEYWYQNTGKQRPKYSLHNEWEKICKSIVK